LVNPISFLVICYPLKINVVDTPHSFDYIFFN